MVSWVTNIQTCHGYDQVILGVRMRRVTHTWMSHESCHTCERVMLYVYMRHTTRFQMGHESCDTREWVISYTCSCVILLRVISLILLYICMTWRIPICDVTHDSFVLLTCLIRVHAVMYSYVWHDSIICVTWRIHRCGMTYSYVGRDLWLMTHSCHMHVLVARVSVVQI